MKRFDLKKRIASVGIATTLCVTISSCASKIDKKSESNSTEFTIENAINEDFDKKNIDFSKNYLDEFKAEAEIETSTSSEFVFDCNAPIIVPIEKNEMQDGKIGYMLPMFYYPYAVDENLPIPGLCGILEITDEYKILSGSNVTDIDGTTTYCGFEGAVAIYKPYWQLLQNKEQIEEDYCRDEVLQLISEVETLAKEVYSSQKKVITKK